MPDPQNRRASSSAMVLRGMRPARAPLVRLELEGLDYGVRAKAESVITDPTMTGEGGLFGISLPGGPGRPVEHLVWRIHTISRNDDGTVTYHGTPYQLPVQEDGE